MARDFLRSELFTDSAPDLHMVIDHRDGWRRPIKSHAVIEAWTPTRYLGKWPARLFLDLFRSNLQTAELLGRLLKGMAVLAPGSEFAPVPIPEHPPKSRFRAELRASRRRRGYKIDAVTTSDRL